LQQQVTVDSHFLHDVHLDSLDRTTIALEIEDEFNIEFPEADFGEVVNSTARVAASKVSLQL
jgi:acyl carrier protein